MGVFASRVKLDQQYIANRMKQTLRDSLHDAGVTPTLKSVKEAAESFTKNADKLTPSVTDFLDSTAKEMQSGMNTAVVTMDAITKDADAITQTFNTAATWITGSWVAFVFFLMVLLTYCMNFVTRVFSWVAHERNYGRQVGNDPMTCAKTCILEIKHNAAKIRESEQFRAVPGGRVKVLTIGIGSGVEAYIYDERSRDKELNELLLGTQISFWTIGEAMRASAKYNAIVKTEEHNIGFTFYIFWLPPPQNPGQHLHPPFEVPWKIASNFCIVASRTEAAAAHSLSIRSSVADQRNLLVPYQPLALESAGVTFHDDRWVGHRLLEIVRGRPVPLHRDN